MHLFRYSMRSLIARRGLTLAAVMGIAFATFIVAALLMMARGLQRALANTGAPNAAIVLAHGASDEAGTALLMEAARGVSILPGIARDPNGDPIAAPELLAFVSTGESLFGGMIPARGVASPLSMSFRAAFHVTEGRAPNLAADEAVVGVKLVKSRFGGHSPIGKQVKLPRGMLTIVGVFDDRGSIYETEMWAGLIPLQTGMDMPGTITSIRLRLERAEALDTLRMAALQDKRLHVDAHLEREFRAKQSEQFAGMLRGIGVLLGGMMGICALLSGMITMFASVNSRRREVGALRALGFQRGAVLFAFFSEALVVGIIGGIVGTVAAAVISLVSVSLEGMTPWMGLNIRPQPTLADVIIALVAALLMGVLGGIAPAFQASRVSAVQALRT